MLLASRADQVVAVIPQVKTHFSPLAIGDYTELWASGFGAPSEAVTITADLAAEAVDWSRRVAAAHPKSLDIGMRRLLSAATARLDPMDGFIDAVMCWENLFGESQETAFKVCGAMSLLLEPTDSQARNSLFGELKKLYGVRSNLVHGSSEPDMAASFEYRDRALWLGLSAMRATYAVPGLLRLKGSTERHKYLLLRLGPSD
jgi:hypothetical protein